MKKLINPIQGVIIITGCIAVFMFIGMFGSLELDKITIEQFLCTQSILILYIAFVWALYKLLDNKKKGRRCWHTGRPQSKSYHVHCSTRK